MAEMITPRLRLRPGRAEDLEAMHSVFSDARAMRFWWRTPHTELRETREWLDRMMAIDPNEGEDFIVEHEGRAIGKAGLRRFPEIGFIPSPRQLGSRFCARSGQRRRGAWI